MAHEIAELDRPFFGSNRAAWHGLGMVLPGQLTSAEAITAARLDWRVDTESVLAGDGMGGSFPVDNAFLTVRSDLPMNDARRILGCVKGRYTPIQNVDAFDIADSLVGESGARFETAGSLRNGKTVWLLAKMPEAARVKDDTIERYLLLTTSHDGSSALRALLTSVRVVCQNTLTAALRGSENQVTIRHTRSARNKIDEARRILGLAGEHWAQEKEMLDYLAGASLTPDSARSFLSRIVPDPKDGANKTRAINTRREIASLYAGRQKGATQQAVRGTAYGMLQAVAEFADHHRTTRAAAGADARQRAENRFESVLYGSAAGLKQKAVDTLLDMLELGESRAVVPAASSDVENLLAGLDLN